MRTIVPSSMFQSTSAAISCSSPAAFSAAIQPLRSPNATGFRSMVMAFPHARWLFQSHRGTKHARRGNRLYASPTGNEDVPLPTLPPRALASGGEGGRQGDRVGGLVERK